jgi:cysteinyl-tRNA synthetase
MDGVLDVVPEHSEADSALAGWVEERLAARKAARQARDFALADAIRVELDARNVLIEDSPGGTRWKLRP